MKATATRDSGYRHVVRVRSHDLSIDEPAETGGTDAGPSPQELLAASLASCTAVTMEMYATRKGWDIGGVEVACEYTPAERGCPTRFGIVVRLPDSLSDEQVERLRVIAARVRLLVGHQAMLPDLHDMLVRPCTCGCGLHLFECTPSGLNTRPVGTLGKKKVDFGGILTPAAAMSRTCWTGLERRKKAQSARPSRTISSASSSVRE